MKRVSFFKSVKIGLLAMILTGLSCSQAQDVTGTWDGVLNVQGMKLKIVLHIDKTDAGYTSKMDSPDQGAFGIPATKTTFDGSKLSVEISNIGMTFEGTHKPNSIEGTFKQGGMSFPLTLARVVEAKADTMPQSNTNEDEIVLNINGFNIYGTLKVPETKEKVPVVLIIAGSGPTDRNCNSPMMTSNSYKMLADALLSNGIATLRYDKRGIAKSISEQKEEDLRFEHYVEDAKGWINLLSENKQFSEIIVAGHSEGSLIGMIACTNNPKVSKFISVAGVGVPADEILKEQLSKNLAGMPDMKTKVFSYIDELKQGRPVKDVPQDLYSLFRPSVQPYMISWLKYNPQEEIKKLNIPNLIVQGTVDVQVSVNEAELLSKANPNAKKVIVENMDHVLKNSKSMDMNEQMKNSYNNPNSPINKELVEAIVDFVKK